MKGRAQGSKQAPLFSPYYTRKKQKERVRWAVTVENSPPPSCHSLINRTAGSAANEEVTQKKMSNNFLN